MPDTTTPAPVTPATGLAPGDRRHGFRILAVTPLPQWRVCAVQAVHEASGAHLLHLHAPEDGENAFAVAFRTPPPDDTGVPHILEHSVLGGSRNYPVKDPFVEMIKGSLATFINALTYSDKTVYPIASPVRRDFFNLAEVYVDAVFHPNISEMTLKQEGHHLELANPADPASPLVIKGIVYNEMKGAYSELDALIERVTSQGLCPDTPYGRDSGGDPDAIPRLTYAQFQGFYERLYHPANARLVIYGDIPTADHLAFLDPRLAAAVAGRGAVPSPQDTALPLQPPWPAPRDRAEPYPIDPGEATAAKSAVTVSWLLGETADPVTVLGWTLLDRLLLGDAAAPLRRALIDSGLGEDLTSAGFSGGTREASFHAGLRGTEPERRDAILKVIFDTLEVCARDGFRPDRVEAAFRRAEYGQREVGEQFPLRLAGLVYDAWMYDWDPLLWLRVADHLDTLRQRLTTEPEFFSRLIRDGLLRNPHRLTALFTPDPRLQAARDAAFAAAMARQKAAMSPSELAAVVRDAAALEALQNEPNTPAALATLPRLRRADLPDRPRPLPMTVTTAGGGVPLVRADVFSNGVNYAALAFDLAGLPEPLWPYVPVFADLLTRLGAGGRSYLEMAERKSAVTGSLYAATLLQPDVREPGCGVAGLKLQFKALDGTFGDALAVTRDFLLALDLSDTRRLRDLLLQAKANARSGVVSSGHLFAAGHAARSLSPLAHLGDLWNGAPALRLDCRLARDFDTLLPEIRANLETLRQWLLRPGRLTAGFCGAPAAADRFADWLGTLAAGPAAATQLPPAAAAPWPAPRPAAAGPEALAFPSEVAFCAMAMPAPHLSAPAAAPLSIFANLLGLGYLWEEIRVKGGAYGGMCAYQPAGQFQLFSYRDPNIVRTLGVFAKLPKRWGASRLTGGDIERAILSCCRDVVRPIRPQSAMHDALARHLGRDNDALLAERYDRMRRVTLKAVRDTAASFLADALPHARACVLAGAPLLAAANAKLATPLAIETLLDEE